MSAGAQIITRADPNSGVEFQIKMENNFALDGRLAFEAAGSDSTRVTWTDWGDSGKNIAFRYMSQMIDGIMGKTFEQSLAALKGKAEASFRQ
jgi:hypothetical protein